MGMNRLGFRTTLIVVVSSLLLLSLLITTIASYMFFKSNTTDDLKRTILNSASYESIRIASHVEKSAKTALGVADIFEQYKDKIPLEDTVKIAAVASSVHKVTVGFDDGRSYASKHDKNFPGGVGDPKLYDPRTRSWFKSGRASSGLTLSDVFFTTRDKEPMLGASHPVDHGVILVDIRLTHMHTLLKEMKVVDGAVGILTDGTGMVMASTAGFVTKQKNLDAFPVLADLKSSVLKSESTFNEINVDGVETILVSKRIDLVTGVKWFLLIAVDTKTAFASANAAILKLKLIAFVICVFSIALLLLVLRQLYKPVLDLKKTVEQLADGEGDLTSRINVSSKDDLGDIARGINLIVSNLQSMMTEVQAVTNELSSGVDKLRVHETQSAEILTNHSAETERVVGAMEQLSASAIQVSEHAIHTLTNTQQAHSLAGKSRLNLESAQVNLQNLADQVTATTEDVATMNSETQDIASILSVIGSIAEQTNLLALNAAIEAARAGDQGRGFAVVADEVRSLAQKTQRSTGEIESALEALKGRAESVVTAVERTGGASQNAVTEAQTVAENLGELIDFVGKINELNDLISKSAHDQSSVVQETNRNMARIHKMVEELNEKGQVVQSETKNIEALNKKLVGFVSRFKLK